MVKAYYLDTDNICNFKLEYRSIVEDMGKGDIVYLLYTVEGNKSRALNSLMYLHHVSIQNIHLIKCKPGYQSLDLHLIKLLKEKINDYYNIIVSNDKGYDEVFKEDERVERRGTLELGVLSKKGMTGMVDNGTVGRENMSQESKEDRVRRFYNYNKAKLSRLDNLVGKYVIANIYQDNKLSYIQDKTLDEDRTWTFYLDGAFGYTAPEFAYDGLKRWNGNGSFLVYVTDIMVEREKAEVYKYLYNSIETIYNA